MLKLKRITMTNDDDSSSKIVNQYINANGDTSLVMRKGPTHRALIFYRI